ncbi:MAG: hypothetical protein ORN49_11320, partial [Rhodobacteraceae bacterium]|nr:hypothetical protein [Paracoccaceae bacterium]
MSEPQAEREIMDVLSSIRRLVSEDRRAKPAPLAERVEPQLAPPVSQAQALDDSTPHVDNAHAENRLVLTPALRVDALPEGASGWAEDARREAQAADGAGSLEATIAELEAAVAEIEADFEPDG